MKEEGRYKVCVSMLVIVGMVIAGAIPMGVLGAGDLPYYDIEQDSLGNYHKAFINNSEGNYEVYYTNDIGGQFPQDWNPPTRITNTTTESYLLDLGIYLPTDTMFIIWVETTLNSTPPVNLTYYALSRDYGGNWTESRRSGQKILLKYAEFDPLIEEPEVPPLPDTWWTPYAYYIVQMKTPTIQEWWDGIEAVGGLFCGYIPNNAYIVWMTPQVKDQVEQLPYTRWIGAYHPLYKIDDELYNYAGIIEVRVLVFDEPDGQYNINKTIQEIVNLGGNITDIDRESYIIRAEINATKIEDIAYIPEVEWIETHHSKITEMSKVRGYTGADYVFTQGGYDGCKENGVDHIIGGVSDNGIDYDHTEFQNTLLKTYPTSPIYKLDHGTMVFGIIFSEGKNANAKGMLPEGRGIFMDMDEGYERGQAMSALYGESGLFLCSAWSEGDYDGMYKAVTSKENDKAINMYWRTMVYPTGNGGSRVSSDAASKNIISVGGMDEGADDTTLTDDVFWPSSCYGTADGRQKPDLVGPAKTVYYTKVGGYGTPFIGTSVACAVVSGADGLVYEMYKYNHFGNNPSNEIPMESTVKALLIANAYQYDLSTQATREQQGWGAVDLKRMHEVGDQHYIINQDVNLKTGDKSVNNFYVTNAPDLRISLVWRDKEAEPPVSKALVNDLDLKVTSPTGEVYWGNNGLENSHRSTSGTSDNHWSDLTPKSHEDNLNNVENVFIQNPETGNWKIEVIGTAISEDVNTLTPEIDQHFALVVSCKDFYKTVTLYPGWNLISLPLIQSLRSDQTPYNYKNSEQLEIVLRSITGYYESLQYFDASDGDWKHWHIDKPEHLNDLKVLGHRMGFWIYVIGISAPDTITLKVYGWEFTSDQEIELWDGWNMVGYPSTVIQNRDTGLNNLDWDIDIDAIEYFDGQSKTWKFMEDPLDEFGMGVGYWMHYKDDVQGNPVNWVIKYI